MSLQPILLSGASAMPLWPARTQVIQAEPSWMRAPREAVSSSRIGIARWAKPELTEPVEHVTDHEEPAYTISYCLRHQHVSIMSGSRTLVSSEMFAGHALVQPPTADVRRGRFRSGYHVLRLYLPTNLIDECYESATGRGAPRDLALFEPYVISDPVLDALSRSLINVTADGGALGPTFVDGVGVALAARLVVLSLPRGQAAESTPSSLPKWRLKKVVAYIDEHFHEPIYLEDLSSVAGLSRMHFASQFRAATGVTPHAYILKRRIEAAQKLLLDREQPIASVALAVGFSSQAHLSSVFKKIVGISPSLWRAAVTSH